jgi:riboflavin synthase
MFTGLIEEVGQVALVQHQPHGSVITVHAQTVLNGLQLGDSVAIDGACTTVVSLDDLGFTIEASPETLRKTTFNQFQEGTLVNLERPLTPQSRIGGHYVTGHIDGMARLVNQVQDGMAIAMTFEFLQPELAQYVVPKGSIAVSGISLTVNEVQGIQFAVAIIPHTVTHTNLSQIQVGDCVNIETDLLGKYVQKFLLPTLNRQDVSASDESVSPNSVPQWEIPKVYS